GSQLKAAAGFCFDPTACKASGSTRAGTVSSSARSRCGADMVGMLVPTWMQERRVSAPGLLVLLRAGPLAGLPDCRRSRSATSSRTAGPSPTRKRRDHLRSDGEQPEGRSGLQRLLLGSDQRVQAVVVLGACRAALEVRLHS